MTLSGVVVIDKATDKVGGSLLAELILKYKPETEQKLSDAEVMTCQRMSISAVPAKKSFPLCRVLANTSEASRNARNAKVRV